MKKLESVTEYITPKDVARQLKIAPETLRKYANLVDKVNKENFFTRDSHNARMYSKEDITLLKRVIELKNNAGITLEKAVYRSLKEISETSVTDTVSISQNANNDYLKILIEEQKETINHYESLVTDLIESNRSLTDKVQNLITTQEQLELNKKEEKLLIEKNTEKKGFFRRIFKKQTE